MAQHCLAALIALTSFVRVDSISVTKPKDLCLCRNFAREYFYGKAGCGLGKEFFPTYDNSPKNYRSDTAFMQNAICTTFFAKLKNNSCVNLNIGEDQGTWCYVDVRCDKLNGGGRNPGYLSWKKCETGRTNDERFRDYSPRTLAWVAKEYDIWLAALIRYSYPGSRGDQNDPVSLDDFNTSIPEKVKSKVKELAGNEDTPVWFDTQKDSKVPIVLVHGEKVWKLDAAPTQLAAAPGTWTELTCMRNCQKDDTPTK